MTWNACAAISKLLQTDFRPEPDLFRSRETSSVLLDIIKNTQNMKEKLQAQQTLLNYKSLNDLGGPDMLPKAWETISECLAYKTKFSGPSTVLALFDSFES